MVCNAVSQFPCRHFVARAAMNFDLEQRVVRQTSSFDQAKELWNTHNV